MVSDQGFGGTASAVRPGRRRLRAMLWAAGAIALSTSSALTAKNWSDWSAPASIETLPNSAANVNTPAVDGCSSLSPGRAGALFQLQPRR